MRKVALELDSKTLVMLAGILGSTRSDELFEVYEELTDYLTATEMYLVEEFWYHFINQNDEDDIYYLLTHQEG